VGKPVIDRSRADEVAAGRFRRDLYYRIATLRLRIPPLRERRGDIGPLLAHFGQVAAQRMRREPLCFTPAALAVLHAYPWPGNVRELRNLVELVAIMCPCGEIGVNDLPPECHDAAVPPIPAAPGSPDLRSVEQVAIATAVQACGGNLTKAAKRLGIARSTLYMRLAASELMS